MKRIFYGPKDRSRLHFSGFTGARIEVILCSSIQRAHDQPKRIKALGGDPLGRDDYAGLCAYSRGFVAIFLRRDMVSHSLIAHECRHAADFLMKMNSIQYGKKGDREVAALMQEHVTRIVYMSLKSWNTRIKI